MSQWEGCTLGSHAAWVQFPRSLHPEARSSFVEWGVSMGLGMEWVPCWAQTPGGSTFGPPALGVCGYQQAGSPQRL